MDNDDEVRSEVKLFLKETSAFDTSKKPELYNLEAEYAKTKKNKDYVNIITIICSVVVIIGLAIGVNFFIEYLNKDIKISLDSFDDLNLKALLETVGRTQNDLNQALTDKTDLELDMDNDIDQIKLKLDAEKNLIANQRIPEEAKQEAITAAEEEANKQIASTRSKYRRKIRELDKQIDALEEEMKKYDASSLSIAREKESSIDSQRQVFALEKRALKKEYEATISDLRDRLDSQQKQAVEDQKRAVALAIKDYQARIEVLDPIISDERVDSIKNTIAQGGNSTTDYNVALKDSNNNLSDISYLSNCITSIDYDNNLSECAASMDKIAGEMQRNLTQSAEKKFSVYESKIGTLDTIIVSSYDKKYWENPRSLDYKTMEEQDGLIISKVGNDFYAYLVPAKRKNANGKKTVIKLPKDKEVTCVLETFGNLMKVSPVNEADRAAFNTIPLNTFFKFMES